MMRPPAARASSRCWPRAPRRSTSRSDHAARPQGVAGRGQEHAGRVAVLLLCRRQRVGSEAHKGRHQPHRDLADRRRRTARRAGLQAAPGGAAVSLGFGASLDRLERHACACCRPIATRRSSCCGWRSPQPRFDADRFEQRRAQMIAALNQAEQRPAGGGAAHPDGDGVRRPSLRQRPPRACATACTTLAADQLKARAAALLTRSGLIVAAVGDIDAAELARQLDRAFGGLPAGAALPSLPDWKPPTRARTVSVERPVPQSSMLIALPGILREDPDWYAALVMAHILGGGAAVAAVQRGAREARAGLQHLGRPARSARRRRCWWSRPAAPTSAWPESLERDPGRAGAAAHDGVERPGAGRRQDLSQRLAGAVARFLQRDRQPAAPACRSTACRAIISTGARR